MQWGSSNSTFPPRAYSTAQLNGRADLPSTSMQYYAGIIFGNGTKPVEFDDYCLSGDTFTTFTYTIEMASAPLETEDSISAEVKYILTNTGSAPFTISEIGRIAGCCTVSGAAYDPFILIDRTLLDTPVTIPTGGTGVVTYKREFHYNK